MNTAENLGKQLRELAFDNMEITGAVFLAAMRQEAVSIELRQGYVTTDDLREFADQHGIMPPSEKYWGCIFREPEWQVIGFTRSERKSNRGRRIFKWARNTESLDYQPPTGPQPYPWVD